MTLILIFDLDMVNMYHHTKNEVSMSTGSKVVARIDRQIHTHKQIDTHTETHRQDENITSTAYAGGNESIGPNSNVTKFDEIGIV